MRCCVRRGPIPNGTGTTYPDFTNTGTTQPKFDVRVDRDYEDGKKLVFQGGVAGTDGILHSGIGPFDIDNGTVLSYGKVNFSKKRLEGELLHEHPERQRDEPARGRHERTAARFDFKSKTFDFEVGNVQASGSRNVLDCTAATSGRTSST